MTRGCDECGDRGQLLDSEMLDGRYCTDCAPGRVVEILGEGSA